MSEQIPQDADRGEQAGIEGAIRDLELEAEEAEDVEGQPEPIAAHDS